MPIKTPMVALFAFCLIVSCKKNNGTGANGNPNKLKLYIEQYQFRDNEYVRHLSGGFPMTTKTDSPACLPLL